MSATPRRRRTASQDVSVALLNAAEAVLDRDGVAGVTIRAVAQQASVSPMSVYNRFESKDGLIAALAMRALAQLGEAIDVPDDGDAVDRLRRSCLRYRDFAICHYARYSLIFGAGSPLQDKSSEVADASRAVFGVLIELLRAIDPDGQQHDRTEDAQAVWSAIHGAVMIEQIRIGQTPSAAESFDHLLDLLISGLG
jgi:AcrR family transcriptional regulator